MEDIEDTKYTTKVPTFGGDKKDWPYYKAKMESYLAQKDMVELLNWEADIDRDDQLYTTEQKQDALIQKKMLVRTQNRKAAGILLGSINTLSLIHI